MIASSNPTARGWFALGERAAYGRRTKRILRPGDTTDSPDVVHVFQRVARDGPPSEETVWTTFLPGFPDGSFGWARVEQYLTSAGLLPKIFAEYVGQGDSGKPAGYPYGTMERGDLVESLWQAQGTGSTFVITFDYSSLVALELLTRQQERLDTGSKPVARIGRVLIENGDLFADAHSHPWLTTPLLKTPMGKIGAWVAQRSRFAFNQMVKVLWSKEYNVTAEEVGELYEAISRRNGAAFMSNGAGFVDEHKANADRWDLRRDPNGRLRPQGDNQVHREVRYPRAFVPSPTPSTPHRQQGNRYGKERYVRYGGRRRKPEKPEEDRGKLA